MTDLDDHVRFEALMAEALRSSDPEAAIRTLADDPRMPASLRDCVRAVDPDGAAVSGLLVARLRFERLVHGSRRARQWFDEEGDAFAEAFRAYHAEVPPTAALPGAEARLFEAWLDRR